MASVTGLTKPLDWDCDGNAYVELICGHWEYDVWDAENPDIYEEMDGYRCHEVGWMRVGAGHLHDFVYTCLIDSCSS